MGVFTMNGGIKLNIERLSLKEVNAIIIAVENNHYSILPVVGSYGEFEYFLKPEGSKNGSIKEYEMNMLLHELAPDQFGSCNDLKQAKDNR
jgi:hypothetical protein